MRRSWFRCKHAWRWKSEHMDCTVGWTYEGVLCSAGNTEHGCLWEYPVLAKLPEVQRTKDGKVDFVYGDQEVAKSSTATLDHVLLAGEIISFECWHVGRVPALFGNIVLDSRNRTIGFGKVCTECNTIVVSYRNDTEQADLWCVLGQELLFSQ